MAAPETSALQHVITFLTEAISFHFGEWLVGIGVTAALWLWARLKGAKGPWMDRAAGLVCGLVGFVLVAGIRQLSGARLFYGALGFSGLVAVGFLARRHQARSRALLAGVEKGFLDFNREIAQAVKRSQVVSASIGRVLSSRTAFLAINTEGIKKAAAARNPAATVERLARQGAKNARQSAAKYRRLLGELGESQALFLNSSEGLIRGQMDAGNQAQIQSSIDSTKGLRASMAGAAVSIRGHRDSVAKAPKVSQALNAAHADLHRVLDDHLKLVEAGIAKCDDIIRKASS